MSFNIDGINKNTYDLLFSDKEDIRDSDLNENIRGYVINIIDTYTRIREKSIFSSLLKVYFGSKIKFNYSDIIWNDENKEYEFEFLGEKYTFNKLSNLIDDKKAKKELESWKRYKNCHVASMGMALGLKDCKVLTGYLNLIGGKYLHSVIETGDGKIIDWTRNTVMPKEEFVKLTGFTVIESIDNKELTQILMKFFDLNLDSKVLSVFGKELLYDFKKRNPSFLKDNEEIKAIIDESQDQDDGRN